MEKSGGGKRRRGRKRAKRKEGRGVKDEEGGKRGRERVTCRTRWIAISY